MSFTQDSKLSIRENGLRALVELLATQKEGLPVDDPYDFDWDFVGREPLSEQDRTGYRHAIAILEEDENHDLATRSDYITLDLTLEFSVILDGTEKPAETYNLVLTNLKRRLGSDRRLAGVRAGQPGNDAAGPALVSDLIVAGDSTSVDSWADKQIDGVLLLRMKWRQSERDPRSYVPTA